MDEAEMASGYFGVPVEGLSKETRARCLLLGIEIRQSRLDLERKFFVLVGQPGFGSAMWWHPPWAASGKTFAEMVKYGYQRGYFTSAQGAFDCYVEEHCR